ncbi:MAG: hypothetical protein ACK5HT_16885, partial [Draconibacterium sp.]
LNMERVIFVKRTLMDMLKAEFHKPEKTVSWLVKQFETIRSPAGAQIEDKFVPRGDAALVFHFKIQPYLTAPLYADLHRFLDRINPQPIIGIPKC